ATRRRSRDGRGPASAFSREGGCWTSAQSVGDFTILRFDTKACPFREPTQQRREVLVAPAPADAVDDDLVDESGGGQRDVQIPARLETELEVLAQQMPGEGGLVVEVDECRSLVAGEGRSHHRIVEKLEEVVAGHSG